MTQISHLSHKFNLFIKKTYSRITPTQELNVATELMMTKNQKNILVKIIYKTKIAPTMDFPYYYAHCGC